MYYDGSVSCWGRSYNGLYGNGDGANSDRSSPVSFVSGFSPSGSIYAGKLRSVFLRGEQVPTSLKLLVGGDIVLSSSLPAGLNFNSSNGTMWYDGSPFQPPLVFSVTDSFGTRKIGQHFFLFGATS